jgi:hypothetical protein
VAIAVIANYFVVYALEYQLPIRLGGKMDRLETGGIFSTGTSEQIEKTLGQNRASGRHAVAL